MTTEWRKANHRKIANKRARNLCSRFMTRSWREIDDGVNNKGRSDGSGGSKAPSPNDGDNNNLVDNIANKIDNKKR